MAIFRCQGLKEIWIRYMLSEVFRFKNLGEWWIVLVFGAVVFWLTYFAILALYGLIVHGRFVI